MTQALGNTTLSIRLAGLLAVEWIGKTTSGTQSGEAVVHFVKGPKGMEHVPLLIAPFGALDPRSYMVGWDMALRTPIDIPNPNPIPNSQQDQNFLLAWNVAGATVAVDNQNSRSLQATFGDVPALLQPPTASQQSYLNLLPDLKAVTNCPKACTQWGSAANGYLSLTDGSLGCVVPASGLSSYVFNTDPKNSSQGQVAIYPNYPATLPLASEAIYNYGGTDSGGNTVTITITPPAPGKSRKLVFRTQAYVSMVNLPRMLAPKVKNRLDHFQAYYACLSCAQKRTPYLWIAGTQGALVLGDIQHCIMALVS